MYVFVLFSSSGRRGLAAVFDRGIPWTFLLTFEQEAKLTTHRLKRICSLKSMNAVTYMYICSAKSNVAVFDRNFRLFKIKIGADSSKPLYIKFISIFTVQPYRKLCPASKNISLKFLQFQVSGSTNSSVPARSQCSIACLLICIIFAASTPVICPGQQTVSAFDTRVFGLGKKAQNKKQWRCCCIKIIRA